MGRRDCRRAARIILGRAATALFAWRGDELWLGCIRSAGRDRVSAGALVIHAAVAQRDGERSWDWAALGLDAATVDYGRSAHQFHRRHELALFRQHAGTRSARRA